MENILKLVISLGDISQDYMVLVNKDRNIIWFNKRLQDEGFSLKDCKGKYCSDIFKEMYFDEVAIKDAFKHNRVVKHSISKYKILAIPIEVNDLKYVLQVSSSLEKKYKVKPGYEQIKVSNIMTKKIITIPHTSSSITKSKSLVLTVFLPGILFQPQNPFS